jgi:hypothetical protein
MSRRSSLTIALVVCLVAAVIARRADAAGNTCTWKSASASTFTTTGSWQNCGGTYPQSADTVIFDNTGAGNCTISGGPFSVTAMSITSGYTGTITVSSALTTTGADFSVAGGTLNTTAALNVNGTHNLTITGGTVSIGSGGASITGNVTINNSGGSGSDPSLVGYWKMDETSGSTSADSSGQGNPLTWTGTYGPTTDKSASIKFTDTGSWYMAPATTHTTYGQTSTTLASIPELRPTTVTVSAWYKADKVDMSGSEVVSGSNTYGLRLYSNSTTDRGFMVMKRISDNTSAADWIEYRVQVSNVLDGNWHQLVGIITTGSTGSMSVYFDGLPVSGGSYWVNGTSGAHQLGASTTPTSTAAAADAIDWDSNTEGFGLVIGDNPSTNNYTFGKGCSSSTKECAIDEVRVYNRALTDAQITALATGYQPAGGGGTMSLSGTMTVTGSVTVQSLGSLTLSSSSGILKMGSGSTLLVDGTLNSTGGTIQANSGSYGFHVGSSSSAAPVLNINGLNVSGTDSHGMLINGTAGTPDTSSGATTTFSEFDNVAFTSGTTQYMNVFAGSLYLTASGCTFGTTTRAVTLTSTSSTAYAGPRLIFGGATCNGATCTSSNKSDDDSAGTGVPSPTKGGVVSFIRSAETDTSGTQVGFPTAAFDWSAFTWYSTYVAFHAAASSGADIVYVRDESGTALYSWTNPTVTETMIGTPQWTTVSGTHYVYVAANGVGGNAGVVYRLKDSGSALTTDATYSCGCTITSPLSLDSTNVYWQGNTGTGATAQFLYGVVQTSLAKISTSWPVQTPANVSTSGPALFKIGTTSYLFLGITDYLLELDLSGTTFNQNSSPGTITGRVSAGKSLSGTGTTRVFAGDSSGYMWGIDPSTTTTFTGTPSWSYPSSAPSYSVTDNYYDASSDAVHYGTSTGSIIVLNGKDGTAYKTSASDSSYPYTPADSPGSITTAPLYYNGVLAFGTNSGKLYFLDRANGSASPNGVSIIKEYNFGPTESVSTVAYDPTSARYMVSTSSSAQDGRLYYVDAVTDPTTSYK